MLATLRPTTGTETVAATVAEHIRPYVRTIDQDGHYPESGLRALGKAGAFAHHVGTTAPGNGLNAAIAAMAEVGETCLSTAFCVWCQDALAWYLDRSQNQSLRSRLLPAISIGTHLGGTGLSNPMKSFSGIEPLALTGVRVPGGYSVSGRLPWVSNLGATHAFASIFSVGGTQHVMAVFDCAADGLKLAQNAHFIALEGTRTFTVLLRNVFVPDEDVIAEDAKAFVPAIRQGFVLLQLGMALGAARGAAAIMEQDVQGAQNAAWLPLSPATIRGRASALEERGSRLALNALDPARGAFLDVLKLRLDGSWLSLEATSAAALQYGARGYLQGSDIDRRRREAQFVAIVTPSVKHITKELAVG